MTRRDVLLVDSLSRYVNDIKPFHTKLKEFLTELRVEPDTVFNPRITVSMSDRVSFSNIASPPIPALGYDLGGYDDTPYDSLIV